MDQNSQRNTRGRARGFQQPRFSGNQPPRYEGGQPRLPRQPGAFTPRTPWPRQSAQVPQTNNQRHQAPRQENNQHPGSQEVEQISRRVNNLSTGDVPVPIGRGAVRGRRVIEPEITEYYRLPRPESTRNSKQGDTGQKLDLVANYFPIKTYTNWTLYQYRINFSPEEERIGIKRGLLKNHSNTLGAYIFDGTMLFSSKKYDSNEFTLSSLRDLDNQIVTITVIFTSVLEPNDYTYIQVFNLLLRNCLRYLNLTLVGRNYYDPAAKIDIIRHRLQLWPGYETTIGMFDNGLLLRAEISTKVLRQDTVLDFFNECLRNHSHDFMNTFKQGIIGTIVLTQYNNQTYKIDDVDENSSPRDTFQMKDGTRMTYIDYYKKKWNITIRNTNQPLLMSKKKKSLIKPNDKDDNDNMVYLVPELCSLTGITENMRKNTMLMKELADYTRVNPVERVKRYNNFLNRLQSTPDSIASLQKWNLDLDNKLVRLEGRVLSTQKIYSNREDYDSGKDKDWTKYVRSLPMYLSAKLPRWVILYPQQNTNDVQLFVKTIQQVGNGMSFKIPQPEFFPINAGYISGYSTALEQIINQMNPSFILCVTQNNRTDIYEIIKRHLCINRAVPSQVVLLKNVCNRNMSVCTKIAIQINCKLGGAPWKISIPSSGLMIVGFDVCHDKQNKNKSYGALIASINDDHTKFYSSVQPHPSGEELSNHFALSISGALNAYRNLNQKLPARVIIYRDGVGDGQISHVHKTEVKLVREAFKNFYDDKPEPPMAFIIVKKRISTRFFSAPRGAPPSNPPPGTVVDSVITDPTMYDFFLVSQNVRFGTVTPTHYNVIVDTLTDWNPNRMQLLTYKLTHMYYNWSGTVRVPAHCQLAHKLAFLAAQFLQGTPNVALNELLYFL